MTPLITVFILNWNRKDDVLMAIQSAMEQTYRPLEILVVDNASTDGSVEAIAKIFPAIRMISMDKNYGCAGGRNRGIKYANGEFIFFMDNDAILHKRAVETAYETISQNEKIVVVGGSVKLFSSPSEVDADCALDSEKRSYFSNSFQGGVSLHRKSLYERAGTYPDHYVYGGEEGYLSLRIFDCGYLIVTNPNVILWHKKAASMRNHVQELVYRQSRGVSNRIYQWPVELAFIYICRTLIRHPYKAIRTGLFSSWIKKWPALWIKSFVHSFKDRRPVKRKTILIYKNLYLKRIYSIEDALNPSYSYLSCIKDEFIKTI